MSVKVEMSSLDVKDVSLATQAQSLRDEKAELDVVVPL